ncbi:cofG, partial [Symbiodinium sp. CCMP2456]
MIPLCFFGEGLRENVDYLLKSVNIDHVEVFNLKLLTQPAKADILGSIGMAHFLTVAFGNDRNGCLVVFQAIARDVLNRGFTSGRDRLEPWAVQLTNCQDDNLVTGFWHRPINDHDKTPRDLRKPSSYRDCLALHSICGGFTHFLAQLEKVIPEADFKKEEESLKQLFMSGALDPEIQSALENSVPPGDLKSIGHLREICNDVQQRCALQADARNEELARKLSEATFAQLKAQIESDFETLKQRVPDSHTMAVQAAMDVKYIKDRQQTGNDWVAKWLSENCHMIFPSEDQLGRSVAQLSQLVLCTLDCTVYPSNAKMLSTLLDMLCTVLNMSPDNVCHLQCPQHQAQTTVNAALKHRRFLKDGLINRSLDLSRGVTLLFNKDASGRASDERPGTQSCYAVFSQHCRVSQSAWQNSEPLNYQTIGDLALAKVSEMKGYDADNRPSAAARVEQKGTECHRQILASYLQGLELAANDHVAVFDLLQNRYCEFGLAVLGNTLSQAWPVKYFGILQQHQKDVQLEMQRIAYEYWDGSKLSPPKRRPTNEAQEAAPPSLKILSWVGGRPRWPVSMFEKFVVGSKEFDDMAAIKKDVDRMYPAPAESEASSTAANQDRTQGLPDFSVDGGRSPLDLSRFLDLAKIPKEDFQEERLASSVGFAGKPSICVNQHYDIFLGNESNSPLTLGPTELFGFNTGTYCEKLIEGLGDSECNGLVWRLANDLTHVAVDKKLIPLCSFLHECVNNRGLAEVDLQDHELAPKMHPAVERQDPLPVVLRYDVRPVRTLKTNVYRPAKLSENADESAVTAGELVCKPSQLGVIFHGKYNSLLKSNDKAAVVWEATPKSGPKAGPKKVNKKPAAVHEIATPAGEEPTDNDVEEQDALGEFETPPTKKQKVEKKPAAGPEVRRVCNPTYKEDANRWAIKIAGKEAVSVGAKSWPKDKLKEIIDVCREKLIQGDPIPSVRETA